MQAKTLRDKLPADPWNITQTWVDPALTRYWETLFAVTNGYMGLRGTYDISGDAIDQESYPGSFVNGVYAYRPVQHLLNEKGFAQKYHGIVKQADYARLEVLVAGERCRLDAGKVHQCVRNLALQEGLLTATLEWESPSGRRIRIESTRFASMTRVHNAALSYRITALNFSGPVTVESKIVGSVPSRFNFPEGAIRLAESGAADGASLLVYTIAESDFRVASAYRHVLTGTRASERLGFTGDTVTHTFALDLQQGQTVRLDKFACFHHAQGGDAAAVRGRALAEARTVAAAGFDALAREQREYWANYWREHDIVVEGPQADQQAVRFNLYELRQAHNPDNLYSVPTGGLAGDMFGGHVLWDMEMYMFNYFVYNHPAEARQLLMYRCRLLDKARARARELDGIGACFAWDSQSGEESGFRFEAGTAEYHLNAGIAFALRRYYYNTGDADFMYRHCAEALFETSRFWENRGAYVAARDGAFCINAVCGPDEYSGPVNNNCYTNMMVQLQFEFAVEIYREMQKKAPAQLKRLCAKIGLSDREVAGWKKAAERMYIPYYPKLGLHGQDDTYLFRDEVDMSKLPRYTNLRPRFHPLNLWRNQLIKQADLVFALSALGDRFTPQQKRRNFDYYEPRCCHGSSCSPGLHAIMAAELGHERMAYEFFRDAANIDLANLRGNVSAGFHSACQGGVWMTLAQGFAGMRDYKDRLLFDAHLPRAWKRYTFRISYRGRRLEVAVERSGVRLRLLSGPDLACVVGGRPVKVSARPAGGSSAPGPRRASRRKAPASPS